MEDLLPYLHFVVLPQVIDALIIGVALALVALGLTMIFGLLDVINLAHGDLYMLGGKSVGLGNHLVLVDAQDDLAVIAPSDTRDVGGNREEVFASNLR